MTIDQLTKEIADELEIELNSEPEYNEDLLNVKIKNAIRAVRTRRNYPGHFTEDMIAYDLEKYYSEISRLALTDYNQVGAEGQSLHTEDDVQRSWVSRDEILGNIPAFVTVF